MIAHLSGVVLEVNTTDLVLEVSGVGYRIFCTKKILTSAQTETPLSLWTYQAVRENAIDLFGFKNKPQLVFFELLIGISGIGPKTALSILDVASVETLQQAILSRDTSHLTKVSGIGKKNAEKIVLELRDKIGAGVSASGTGVSSGDSDVIDALCALGYTPDDARDALRGIPTELKSTEERIKAALKQLS